MTTNQKYTDAQHDALANMADFDHVFAVIPLGYVTDDLSPYGRNPSAPDALDVDIMATELDGWQLPLSGMSGQYGYTGPWLHDSEMIRGGVADKVLSMPGYWVAIYGQNTPECPECGGAGVLWNDDQTEEIPCPNIAKGTCAPDGYSGDDAEFDIEGWTMAYRPFSN